MLLKYVWILSKSDVECMTWSSEKRAEKTKVEVSSHGTP